MTECRLLHRLVIRAPPDLVVAVDARPRVRQRWMVMAGPSWEGIVRAAR